MRKGLIIKSIVLAVCLAFLAVLPPVLGDLFAKDSPPSRLESLGSRGGPRPTMDMVELQLPR